MTKQFRADELNASNIVQTNNTFYKNSQGNIESVYPIEMNPGAVRYVADTTNPKDLVGSKKTPLSLIPPAGLESIAQAMKNGADKYGAYNWRDKKVQYMIYLDAMMRHIGALIDREDLAEDSKVHHLGHIGANAVILLDAIKYDCLVDNRPGNKQTTAPTSRLDITEKLKTRPSEWHQKNEKEQFGEGGCYISPKSSGGNNESA